MANWIKKTKADLTSINQLEQALMSQPNIRAALNRYVASLDLQGRINRGAITEQQALQLFRKAIQDFSYKVNQKINQRFTPQFINENDLTNPLNMARAINNPNSLASIQWNDTIDSIIFALDEEASENEQVQNQLHMNNEETPTHNAPTPRPQPTSHEKEELLATAALGIKLGKGKIEHVFEKYVGKELKNEFKELDEIISPFKTPTLKPKPPKTDDK